MRTSPHSTQTRCKQIIYNLKCNNNKVYFDLKNKKQTVWYLRTTFDLLSVLPRDLRIANAGQCGIFELLLTYSLYCIEICVLRMPDRCTVQYTFELSSIYYRLGAVNLPTG